ncbi:MAG: hypothetical protein QM758_23925 [Armatimonas sp.]
MYSFKIALKSQYAGKSEGCFGIIRLVLKEPGELRLGTVQLALTQVDLR